MVFVFQNNLRSCTEELRQAVEEAKKETQNIRLQAREAEHRKVNKI